MINDDLFDEDANEGRENYVFSIPPKEYAK